MSAANGSLSIYSLLFHEEKVKALSPLNCSSHFQLVKTMNINEHNSTDVRQDRQRKGFSMLELLIVLTILIGTALIAVPMFSNIKIVSPQGDFESPTELVTKATMNNVRDAMVREDGVIESLSHKSDALPRTINELVREEAPQYLQTNVPELTAYDPVNKIGWHGPYIHATGKNKIGEPTIIDGWGNELQLQIDFDKNGKVDYTESKYIRVVSAGPNGEIETPADWENMRPGKDEFTELTRTECGDDMIVFFRIPDDR
jgi:prepilin-type N-terminal cleavage/methylation domain-containing protein